MKHNNSLGCSSHAKCKCGRYASIGEWKAGMGLNGVYTCPDCWHREHSKPITAEEFYRRFDLPIFSPVKPQNNVHS